MMIHDCIPCQWGDHSKHVEWPSKPPKGVIGGWKCECDGSCETDGRRERRVRTVEVSPEEVARMDEEYAKFEKIVEQTE